MIGTTTRGRWAGATALLVALGCGQATRQQVQGAEVPRMEVDERAGEPETTERWTTAVEPKALGASARSGLDWLVAQQLPSGGWGQGEESTHMRGGGPAVVDRALVDAPSPGGTQPTRRGEAANVADTAMACLALLRADGADGAEPRWTQSLARGIDFVCDSVERSDEDSLFVTDVRGTRVQSKIGTYVDTFLSAQLLAECQARLADAARAARADAALARVLAKIERHQQADGGFAGEGWAPVLSQSIAGKGLQRATQGGAAVSEKVLLDNFGFWAGRAAGPADSAAPGSAGIALYSVSANLGVLQDKANTDAMRVQELEADLASDDADVRTRAAGELRDITATREQNERYRTSVLDRLEDPAFVAGFGSNGGEEFLSYANVSESLVVRGDETWREWDAAMGANLARIQKEDGSWSGHHCITGRTFCTAAALLVLMADRTPVPLEAVAQAK